MELTVAETNPDKEQVDKQLALVSNPQGIQIPFFKLNPYLQVNAVTPLEQVAVVVELHI